MGSLAERGFDPRYGARFLQRTVNEEVVVPLSRWLVDRPGLRDATIALDQGEDGRLRLGRRVGGDAQPPGDGAQAPRGLLE